MEFEEAINIVLKHEGGFVDDPDDRGGATNYGITEAVARENDYTGHMKDLPVWKAKEIYKSQYWDKVKADHLPGEIRYIVFDTAVNMGISRAVKLLQKCGGTTVDGVIGKMTIAASEDVTLERYALERMYFYCQIVRKNQSQAKFIGGWSNRIMDILNESK